MYTLQCVPVEERKRKLIAEDALEEDIIKVIMDPAFPNSSFGQIAKKMLLERTITIKKTAFEQVHDLEQKFAKNEEARVELMEQISKLKEMKESSR